MAPSVLYHGVSRTKEGGEGRDTVAAPAFPSPSSLSGGDRCGAYGRANEENSVSLSHAYTYTQRRRKRGTGGRERGEGRGRRRRPSPLCAASVKLLLELLTTVANEGLGAAQRKAPARLGIETLRRVEHGTVAGDVPDGALQVRYG